MIQNLCGKTSAHSYSSTKIIMIVPEVNVNECVKLLMYISKIQHETLNEYKCKSALVQLNSLVAQNCDLRH